MKSGSVGTSSVVAKSGFRYHAFEVIGCPRHLYELRSHAGPLSGGEPPGALERGATAKAALPSLESGGRLEAGNRHLSWGPNDWCRQQPALHKVQPCRPTQISK